MKDHGSVTFTFEPDPTLESGAGGCKIPKAPMHRAALIHTLRELDLQLAATGGGPFLEAYRARHRPDLQALRDLAAAELEACREA